MAEDIFRELQQRLDLYSLGFPATKSNIEIKILKSLFDEKDARLFLEMSPRIEEPAAVAERTGRPADQVAAQLEDMAKRGLLFRVRKGESVKYGAIPFMHGLMEFQITRFNRELSEMLEEYFAQGFHGAIAATDGLFLRTIPVQRSIVPENRVAAYEDAVQILKSADTIAVAECACRKGKKLQDTGCGKPMETCFMFGSMARFYVENGMGRGISADEAIRILTTAQETGLVTQPATAQNPAGMCCCCGDCCGVLGAIKKHPRPAEIVFSNYQARVDADACTGCESCLERCQMDAITMNAGGTAEIGLERCIGCGLCVTACPAEAVSLAVKSGDSYKIPPATSAEQMMTLAKKRGVI
ncbi:MAG: 4Fe-4S dicluster domain-containing protein [Spirochaetes bacterium]|nr:MAG: 4Fe-4S dicluster domain-containing protein [Spirochaetota bacterium]